MVRQGLLPAFEVENIAHMLVAVSAKRVVGRCVAFGLFADSLRIVVQSGYAAEAVHEAHIRIFTLEFV